MRILAGVLVGLLLMLQARLWLSDDGYREVWRLRQAVSAQRVANIDLRQRNDALDAEVQDLKQGLEAVEERARSELGMVGGNETFYQIVSGQQSPTDEDG